MFFQHGYLHQTLTFELIRDIDKVHIQSMSNCSAMRQLTDAHTQTGPIFIPSTADVGGEIIDVNL